jgi:DNA (cytosine-5)-methyltransferase 1
MNYLDLFHGIGGFALGAYWAGMKFDNHYCSDIEPYTQKLYKLRFPDSIQLGDITKIDTSTLPTGDWIITGGFPCQDISIAGKGAGIHGDRSGLWFEYWRIIRDLRPRFAIMENVGMLIHRGLREVLGSLAEIGYNAEWQDIRASDMGAPHRRERIWIVAYAGGTGIELSKCRIQQEREKHEWPELDDVYKNMADAGLSKSPRRNKNKERSEGASCNEFAPCRKNPYASINELQGGSKEQIRGKRNISREPGRMGQDFGNGWSVEPAVGRLVNGISGRVDRLKGLGNAIVPQIAELLFRQIKNL